MENERSHATQKAHIKDFDRWHAKKRALHEDELDNIPYYNEREVWFCVMGCNIGYEQDGKGNEYVRPVLSC